MDTTTRQQTFYLDEETGEPYSSTQFRYKDNHCGKALKLHRLGIKENDDIFQVGIAAHAVLQAIGENKVAANEYDRMRKIGDAVYAELITSGHTYFGKKFPPMPAKAAADGRALALQWLQENSLPLDGKFENVLAMNWDGSPCDYTDPHCCYRSKIDVLHHLDKYDEESYLRLICIPDHKTNWGAGEDDLDSLQSRSHAVMAWLHYPDYDGVELVINNLRTGKSYSRTLLFGYEDIELLKQWRKDILMQCDAADKNLEARPGVGCETCPFSYCCEEAQEVAAAEKNSAALAVIENKRSRLKDSIRHQLQDADGIACGEGWVGFNLVKSNVVTESGLDQILANWYSVSLDRVGSEYGAEKGLLVALGLGPTNVENYIKARFNGEHKAEKDDFRALCLKVEYESRFGIWKNGAVNGHTSKLKLLPENTVLVDPPPKPEKAKRVKPEKSKKVKQKIKKKPKAKAKKKIAKSKTSKKKRVVRGQKGKGKHIKAKATSKKPKSGRKGRKQNVRSRKIQRR